MSWKVAYIVPGDVAPVEEFFDTKDAASDFANRVVQAGWYVITIEEVRA